jgi:pimeloyl-ACP methyl ester carboxylesterase
VDDIIDLGEYLRRRDEAEKPPRTAFAVWGGDGERARFALPLWRVVYLAGGARGGLVWTPAAEEHPARLQPFVVLDLAEEPARTRFNPLLVHGLEKSPAPTMRMGGDSGVAVHLGEHDGRRWYLVVDETTAEKSALDGRARDDILFLAGECAGLLFFRGFSTEAGDTD